LGIKFFEKIPIEILSFGHSAFDFVVYFIFSRFFGAANSIRLKVLMGDYTWFWAVLGIKWGFLKFSDFRQIEFVFLQTRKNFFYIELISL